jgi:hypothetical protein
LSSGLKTSWDQTKKYKKPFVISLPAVADMPGSALGHTWQATALPSVLPAWIFSLPVLLQAKTLFSRERKWIIQVNWHFQTGLEKRELQNGRWLFFQDGAVIKLPRNASVIILGRYSSNNNIAASVTPFGNG